MADPTITRCTIKAENLKIDEYGRAKAQVQYILETSGYMTSDAAVAAAAALVPGGLPAIWAPYSALRPFCRCTMQDVDRLSPTQWEVTCWFEDPTAFSGTGDPLAQAATLVTGVELGTEEREYDGRGARVATSAKSRFSRAPAFSSQVAVYGVTKIVNAATKAAIKAAAGTVNADAITIDGDAWAAGEAWLVLPQNAFTPYVMGATTYWTASYAIRCKRGGWKVEVADIGFVNADGKTPKEVIVGVKVNPPMGWPLNGAGAFQASASDEPAKLTFWDAPEADWTGVPIS